jgi:signal transduction histidine kinase
MLIVSLAFGLISLWRSVTQQIEQVQRMENFVAAVTHELRTPLSAIRLHGEMLLDGWATSGDQQQEYYRRIVRETGRLSSLVERVLEKSRLSSGQTQAVPGDLNHEIRRLQPSLELGALKTDGDENGAPVEPATADEPRDLVFYLEDDLPPVFLTSEAIATLVANLVENARKYAPVDRRSARGATAARWCSRSPIAAPASPRTRRTRSSRRSTGSATKRRAPRRAPAWDCTCATCRRARSAAR